MSFITCTIGLNAVHGTKGMPKMTKVFFSEVPGGIKLQPVSGNNLANKPGARVIAGDEFEGRPEGGVECARWALDRCGYRVA